MATITCNRCGKEFQVMRKSSQKICFECEPYRPEPAKPTRTPTTIKFYKCVCCGQESNSMGRCVECGCNEYHINTNAKSCTRKDENGEKYYCGIDLAGFRKPHATVYHTTYITNTTPTLADVSTSELLEEVRRRMEDD